MGNVDYRPDREGMAALVQSPGVGAACVAAAGRGLVAAEAAAARFVKSGEYARSFKVRPAVVHLSLGRNRGPRAGAILENTAPYAATLEYQQGKHVLRDVIDVIERG